MRNKKDTTSSLKRKKLANKIHKWAHLDAQKNPKKFEKLFYEIWETQFKKERQSIILDFSRMFGQNTFNFLIFKKGL